MFSYQNVAIAALTWLAKLLAQQKTPRFADPRVSPNHAEFESRGSCLFGLIDGGMSTKITERICMPKIKGHFR